MDLMYTTKKTCMSVDRLWEIHDFYIVTCFQLQLYFNKITTFICYLCLT